MCSRTNRPGNQAASRKDPRSARLRLVSLPKCLEGAGHKEVGCGGLREPVGAARAAMGGGRSREPCATTLAVAPKSCESRAASTPA